MRSRRVLVGGVLAAALTATTAAAATTSSVYLTRATSTQVAVIAVVPSQPAVGCRVSYYVVVATTDGSPVSQSFRYSSGCLGAKRAISLAAPKEPGAYQACLVTMTVDSTGQTIRRLRCIAFSAPGAGGSTTSTPAAGGTG